MPYCPECGTEVRDQANFCMECGERLYSERIKETEDNATKSPDKNRESSETPQKASRQHHSGADDRVAEHDSRTISINDHRDREKFINADSITYMEVVEVNPGDTLKKIGRWIFRIPILLISIFFLLSLLFAEASIIEIVTGVLPIFGGVIIMAGILWIIIMASFGVYREEMELGTLNDNHRLEGDQVNDVEQKFRDASLNLLTINSTHKNRIRISEFRYSFIPDNIVSMTYEEGNSVSLLFLSYNKPDRLIVEFKNSESKHFRLSTEDRKQVINEFSNRGQRHQRVEANSIQADNE